MAWEMIDSIKKLGDIYGIDKELSNYILETGRDNFNGLHTAKDCAEFIDTMMVGEMDNRSFNAGAGTYLMNACLMAGIDVLPHLDNVPPVRVSLSKIGYTAKIYTEDTLKETFIYTDVKTIIAPYIDRVSSYAISHCGDLKYVMFDTAFYLDSESIYDCPKLESVYAPECYLIERGAFSYCNMDTLKSVEVNKDAPYSNMYGQINRNQDVDIVDWFNSLFIGNREPFTEEEVDRILVLA